MSQTVARAIAIVEFLAEGPRSLGDVAQHVGVHKSTALRLLQTLETARFARRSDEGMWLVGIGLIGIAQHALDSLDVRTVAAPHLRRLEKLCGHTVHLAQLVDDAVVYVDKADGHGSVRMHSRIGKKAEMHASGIGKAILAFIEEPLREEIISGLTLQQYTATTITTPEGFRRELQDIRERGWARDRGEFEGFVNCIAAPIRGSDGRVRVGLSIATLHVLSPLEELEHLVPELLDTADAISRGYGWPGP